MFTTSLLMTLTSGKSWLARASQKAFGAANPLASQPLIFVFFFLLPFPEYTCEPLGAFMAVPTYSRMEYPACRPYVACEIIWSDPPKETSSGP